MGFRYYWEDFPAGWRCEHGSRTLSEAEIIAFAKDWDPQRFHTDPRAAKDTMYGGVIASAWHTGCVMMRMMCDAYLKEASCIGSPGIESWMFPLPVRPGDTLRYRATVLEARPSASKPEGHPVAGVEALRHACASTDRPVMAIGGLTVARAAGLSAWQFVSPALASALILGALATALYNPLSAVMQERARKLGGTLRLHSDTFVTEVETAVPFDAIYLTRNSSRSVKKEEVVQWIGL